MNFSILTYNLGKSRVNFRERLKKFFNLIESANPDIIVLQECTQFSYQIIFKEMGIFGYSRHELHPLVKNRETGEIIFISKNHNFVKVSMLPFTRSNQNRGLTMASIKLCDGPLVDVYTSQFEVGSRYTHIRRDQLQSTPKIIEKHTLGEPDIAIFAGDTGILSYQGNLRFPEGWYDTWEEAGSETEKYTVDFQTNPLISDTNLQDRPDQIWFKTKKCICVHHEIFGRFSGISVHHGVFSKFNMDKVSS